MITIDSKCSIADALTNTPVAAEPVTHLLPVLSDRGNRVEKEKFEKKKKSLRAFSFQTFLFPRGYVPRSDNTVRRTFTAPAGTNRIKKHTFMRHYCTGVRTGYSTEYDGVVRVRGC